MQNSRVVWNFRYRVVTNVTSPSFYMHGKNEISFLAEQFFPEISVGIIMTEW